MDRRKFMITGASAMGAITTELALPSWAQAENKKVLQLIIQPEPPILIAAFNQQAPTQYVSGKMFQSLLTYTFDLEPRPGLAKSWDVAPDGLSVTFHLQEGVKWHDGHPFTADDVVFSLADMLPKVHARARAILNTHAKSVDKIDDLTVRLNLKAPFPAVMLMFEPGFAPMLPKHVYEGTDYMTNPANQHPIGTGPFMFKEWQRGSFIHLVRNPHYWKPDMPYLDELIFNVIPDSSSRAVAFQNGRIDVLYGGDVDNVDIKRLSEIDGVTYTTKGWEMFSPLAYLIFNMRKPPFDNVKVRQAMMYAMNREAIVKNIFFGLGQVANGPFVPTELYYDPNLPPYKFDPKKARELIKESGINPADHTIRLLSFPYGSTWDRLDEYTRQTLEQLGFKVDLQSTDGGGWAARTGDWDFDITTTYSYQYGDPALGVERLYVARNIVKGSPFANAQGYNNPALDTLWSKASASTDPKERQALYSEIQKTLVEEVGNGFLVDMEFATLYRSNIKNLVTTAIGLNESFDNVHFEN
ncbi:ABC transporter substrate-binding protein [Castellaniella sp.]|uniref:ABC transporter substrate-binding protein n=1 Tax=Castellaniella sp. TaxID=1955812 RepID=UPI00356A59A1